MVDKRPGSLPVMGEATDKYFFQWDLVMQKQGLQVGWKMITQKVYEIHLYVFGSMCSVGSVGKGWCDIFMSRHGELTLITNQVIKCARNKARLVLLRSFFCDHVST